jgi:hypothetical protein
MCKVAYFQMIYDICRHVKNQGFIDGVECSKYQESGEYCAVPEPEVGGDGEGPLFGSSRAVGSCPDCLVGLFDITRHCADLFPRATNLTTHQTDPF